MFRGVLLLIFIFTLEAHSADIVGEMRKTSLESSDGLVGYFELGLESGWRDIGWVSNDNGLYAELAAGFELRYKKMFAEGVHGTSDGLNIGYNFIDSSNWSVDLLTFSGGIAIEDLGDENDMSEGAKNRRLEERLRAFGGLGIRVSRYWDEYVFQFRLINDVFSPAGTLSTLRVGRNLLYRNWNFHSIGSVVYSSAKTNQHFMGVQRFEATEKYPEYYMKDSVHAELEFGATYPVTENWVFKGVAKVKQMSKSQQESPLVDEDFGAIITGSMTYVF